ncbi:unnamed protein product, partial [Prorocentrum cordatum]
MRQRFRREGSCFRRLRSGVRRVKPSSWNGRGRERTREGARENAERGRGRQRERARPFGPGPVQAQPRALGAAWACLTIGGGRRSGSRGGVLPSPPLVRSTRTPTGTQSGYVGNRPLEGPPAHANSKSALAAGAPWRTRAPQCLGEPRRCLGASSEEAEFDSYDWVGHALLHAGRARRKATRQLPLPPAAGTGREDASTAVPNCGHQGAPEEEEEGGGGGGGERGREGKGERRRGVTGGRGCAPLVLRRHGLRAVVEEALAAAGRLRRGAAAAQHRGLPAGG